MERVLLRSFRLRKNLAVYKGAMEEIPPPPKPVAAKPRKRCQHDYSDKWHCPVCSPCPGGHGKVKSKCGVCTGDVVEHDSTTLPQNVSIKKEVTDGHTYTTVWVRSQEPVQPGEPCNHTHMVGDGAFRNYSRASACPICNDCGHGKVRQSCGICNRCPHNKLKNNCIACYPCPHGRRKRTCAMCIADRHPKTSEQPAA